jgi:hypothetical protein
MSLLPDEGNQEQPTGGQESPTSAPSGSQQGQPLPDVGALVRQVEELGKQVKGIQKGTDKRFEQIGGNIKRILELKEQGLNESQIQRELWIDSQMQGQNLTPEAPVGNAGGRQAPDVESFTAADAISQIEKYNLPVNDSSVLELLRDKNLTSGKVKDYILQKVAPQKPASVADVVQSPVRGGQQEKSQTALTQEYLTEMSGARGKGYQVGDAIKAKFREKGLNVDEIVIRV